MLRCMSLLDPRPSLTSALQRLCTDNCTAMPSSKARRHYGVDLHRYLGIESPGQTNAQEREASTNDLHFTTALF